MQSKLPVTRVGRARGQRGNALLEFALMSTVLMGMTLGVADFGRVFAMGNRATTAAMAGTAYGALDAEHYSQLGAMETAATRNLVGFSGATATASRTCRCGFAGSEVGCGDEEPCGAGVAKTTYIQVVVSIPFQSLSGLPMLPGLTNVKGKSIIRVE